MREIIINNKKFSISETNYGWWDVVSRGLWEPFTFKIIDKFVEKDDVCIDLGAWFGFISLYCAQTAVEIHSVEPDIVAFTDLKNSANNTEKYERIILHNCAIANYNGLVKMGNPNNLGDSMTRFNQEKNQFEVKCYTISTFCQINNINKVDFLKVDIEGSEEYLFQDIDFFEKYQPTLFVQLHRGWFLNSSSAMENFKKVSKIYKHMYDENLNRLDNLNDNISTCVLSQKFL